MKILINNASTFKGGAEQVALSFIEECKKYPENQYTVVIAKNLASHIKSNDFPENFSFIVIPKRPASNILSFYLTMRLLRKVEREFKPNCVITTGGHGYWIPKTAHVSGYNMAHYIYPESPYFELIPHHKRIYWGIRKIIDFYFFGRCDALICQTDDINMRLKRNFNSLAIYTVYNTIHPVFHNYPVDIIKLPVKKNKEIRLLTVSSYYPHKNLAVINKVVDLLKNRKDVNIRFVLTLPHKIFFSSFPNKSTREYIHNVGPVPINEVPSLYEECDLMFLPTLLECFSASYVEAMYMKKPILTSDLGFAHTICDDAAVYFDSLDPVDIVDKIIQTVNNPSVMSSLIEKGIKRIEKYKTSESRALKYLEICRITSESKNS